LSSQFISSGIQIISPIDSPKAKEIAQNNLEQKQQQILALISENDELKNIIEQMTTEMNMIRQLQTQT